METIKTLLEEGMLLIRSRADGETVVEVGPALQAERSALRGLLPKSVREVIHVRLSRFRLLARSCWGQERFSSGALTSRRLWEWRTWGRQKA